MATSKNTFSVNLPPPSSGQVSISPYTLLTAINYLCSLLTVPSIRVLGYISVCCHMTHGTTARMTQILRDTHRAIHRQTERQTTRRRCADCWCEKYAVIVTDWLLDWWMSCTGYIQLSHKQRSVDWVSEKLGKYGGRVEFARGKCGAIIGRGWKWVFRPKTQESKHRLQCKDVQRVA